MRNNRTVQNRFVRHVRQSALFSQVPLLLRASPFFFFFVAFFFIHTILRRFITRRWMDRWKFSRKCRQIRRCAIGRSLFSRERLQRRIAIIKPILRKSLSPRLDFYLNAISIWFLFECNVLCEDIENYIWYDCATKSSICTKRTRHVTRKSSLKITITNNGASCEWKKLKTSWKYLIKRTFVFVLTTRYSYHYSPVSTCDSKNSSRLKAVTIFEF